MSFINPPSPENLFLTLWNQAASEDEEGLRPGTETWNRNPKACYRYWAELWIECKRVSEYIRDFEDLQSQVKDAMKE